MGCCSSQTKERNSQRRSRKTSQGREIDCSSSVSTELTLLSNQLTRKSKSYHTDHIKEIERTNQNLEKTALNQKLKKQQIVAQLEKSLRNDGLIELATALEADLPPEMIEAAHLQSHQLRSLPDLSYFFNLKRVFLYDNNLESMAGVGCLRELVFLDLSKNSISRIENLEGLEQLQQLFLNDNKISKIQNLETLLSLRVLHLHNNRLQIIEGLQQLKRLRTLSLKNNLIRTLQNLEQVTELETLDIDGNPLDLQSNLQALKALRSRKVKLNEWWLYI